MATVLHCDRFVRIAGVEKQASRGLDVTKKHLERQRRFSRSKRLVRWLFSSSKLRVVRKEATYFSKLSARCTERAPQSPVPGFVGYVETSDGAGALWRAICDEQGKLAATSQNFVDENRLDEVLEPLNFFVPTCFQVGLVIADMHCRYLVRKQSSSNKELCIGNGFGDHRMIPFRTMFQQYNHVKLIKGFDKLSRQTGLTFDDRSKGFCLDAI